MLTAEYQESGPWCFLGILIRRSPCGKSGFWLVDIFLSVERRNYFFQLLCVLKWQRSHVTEYPKGKVKVARCDPEWFHCVVRAAAGRFIINQTFLRKPHSNLKKKQVWHTRLKKKNFFHCWFTKICLISILYKQLPFYFSCKWAITN